jgi:hypothetical protein
MGEGETTQTIQKATIDGRLDAEQMEHHPAKVAAPASIYQKAPVPVSGTGVAFS